MKTVERPTTAKTYKLPVPRTWWLRNRRYLLFILREASSIFLGIFVVQYIVQLALLAAGAGPYERYLSFIKSPAWVAVSVMILVFAIIHTVTWLSLVPAVTPLRAGKREAPRLGVTAGAIAFWLVVSVLVALFIMRG